MASSIRKFSNRVTPAAQTLFESRVELEWRLRQLQSAADSFGNELLDDCQVISVFNPELIVGL